MRSGYVAFATHENGGAKNSTLANRQRELERALRNGGHVPLRFRTVALFTVGGVALALMTVVLVIAQT